MHPRFVILALTLGNMASTDASQQESPVRDKPFSLQLRREPSLTAGITALERRTQTYYKRKDCPQYHKKLNWNLHWPHHRRDHGNDDRGGDDCNKCEGDEEDEYCTSSSSLTPGLTTTVTATIVPTVSSTLPLSSITNTAASNTLLPSSRINSEPSASATAAKNQQDDLQRKDSDNNWMYGVIAVAIVILFLLLFIGYWVVVRPRRRNRLSQQPGGGFPKDADLESHVTVDLRIQTPRSGPHDPSSSSDALSGYTVNIAGAGNTPGLGRSIFESAAASVSMSTPPGSAHARMHPATQRTLNDPSPAMSHDSLRDIDEAQRLAHSEARQPQTYVQMGRPQGPVPRLPPPLQICAPPIHSSSPEPVPAVELDDRPPPPRYPEATATSPASCDLSPISPIIVSPLSITSAHGGYVQPRSVPNEPPYHPQQQQDSKGPQQPSYEGYEPSTLPEVVSPIVQLGQTSASLPEYDESAEAAREGDQNNHHSVPSRNPDHEGGEKQASPQPMPRY